MKILELIEADNLVSQYYAGRSINAPDSHNDFVEWLYNINHAICSFVDLNDRQSEEIGEIVDDLPNNETLADIMGEQDLPQNNT